MNRSYKNCLWLFMITVILTGGVGEKASAQLVLCFEDPADLMAQLEHDLADCQDTLDAALAAANKALKAAKAAHATAVQAAVDQWWLDTQACNALGDGQTGCIKRAYRKRDAAIDAADAALAAANQANFAAITTANDAYDDCVEDAVNRFLECMRGAR